MKKIVFIFLVFVSVACKGQMPGIGGFQKQSQNEPVGCDCTTAYLIYDSISFNHNQAYIYGSYITSDGTKFFQTTSFGNKILTYNLSTPNDISTAVLAHTLTYSTYGTRPTGITFSHSGDYCYVTEYNAGTIKKFQLSTPYDLSSLTQVEVSAKLTPNSPSSFGSGIEWNEDGTELIFGMYSIYNSAGLYSYSPDTAYGVTNLTAIDTLTTGMYTLRSFKFMNNGYCLFRLNNTNINAIVFSQPYNIGSYSSSDNFSFSGYYGIAISGDGSKLYLSKYSTTASENITYQYSICQP